MHHTTNAAGFLRAYRKVHHKARPQSIRDAWQEVRWIDADLEKLVPGAAGTPFPFAVAIDDLLERMAQPARSMEDVQAKMRLAKAGSRLRWVKLTHGYRTELLLGAIRDTERILTMPRREFTHAELAETIALLEPPPPEPPRIASDSIGRKSYVGLRV